MKKKALKKEIKRLKRENSEYKAAANRASKESMRLYISNEKLGNTISQLTRDNIDLKSVLKAKEILEAHDQKECCHV